MDKRPSMADLVPGARLAGPSEAPVLAGPIDFGRFQQSVATFGAGTLRFEDSGHVCATGSIGGWIVVDFGGYQRAFTRLSRDAEGGSEVWLQAAWNGAPTSVMELLRVQANAAAGFGSRKDAAHHWNSGMFLGSANPTWYDLYRDGTGPARSTTPFYVDGGKATPPVPVARVAKDAARDGRTSPFARP